MTQKLKVSLKGTLFYSSHFKKKGLFVKFTVIVQCPADIMLKWVVFSKPQEFRKRVVVSKNYIFTYIS